MSYSNFTVQSVESAFGLTLDVTHDLFASLPATTVSDLLQAVLDENVPLALAVQTEKARSEWIVAPVVVELRKRMDRQISVFSGGDFPVAPDKGLSGVCDFLVSRSPTQLYVTAPVLLVVEAKNENIIGGLGPCIAEMVAARMFNEQQGNDITTLYGAVTAGNIWRFLTLEGDVVYVDMAEYHISQVGKILAILLHMVGKETEAHAKR